MTTGTEAKAATTPLLKILVKKGLTFCPYIYIMRVRAKSEVMEMSPRTGRPPKGEEKKSERIEIRITQEKAQQLKDCAKRLGISRAAVIEKGIDMVDEETKK